MIDNEQTKQVLIKYLCGKLDAQYFGKVLIVFNKGKVVHIIEEKSLKLENLKN